MASAGDVLLASLQSAPHEFLQPSLPLYTDTVAYLKNALDPLAADISTTQQERLKEQRKKRKRGQPAVNEDVLRLNQIHTEGFGAEQVWEQARRVIEAAKEEAERGLQEALERDEAEEDDLDPSEESELGEEGVDFEVEGIDDGEEQYVSSEDDDEEDEDEDLDPDATDQHDDFDDIDMDDDMDIDGEDLAKDEPTEEFVEDKFGLNDGFFSIDDFNRKSEFLEQQDARGDDDGAASDEEDVDWDADPSSQVNGTAPANGEEEDDDDDDEDGPVFGDPDAESEDDEDMEIGEGDLEGIGDMGNTNSVMYADFFAPPASKKKKNKKGRPNPHNFPEKSTKNDALEQDDDVERTMAAVHRDLFDDEDSAGEQDDEAAAEDEEALDPADPRSRRSAHERRKAALAEEIRKLEAANVAKRQWTLSGEARAADRPVNSLLEEDLEFERTGKPIPVITAETNESLEALIKRRILAHEFEDLIRRRPDDLATGGGRRGRVDGMQLEDSKSKKGLAEEYEEEYSRRHDPNFVEEKDEKMRKEEGEILALWEKVRADLDGLSSWNFRPKAPKPSLEVRVDAPAVLMEDARPSAGEGMEASALAPQEVYSVQKDGEAKREGEVVGKSGVAVGREEMSRDERKRRRRREKERIRKGQGQENGGQVVNKKAKERREMVGDLKKGGVKVIGKKGDLKDVEGNEVREGGGLGAQQGAGRYKL